MARLRRNIATAPVSKRKAARPAKAGGGPRLVGTEERLAKTLSDRGVPLAVARRIVSRMADAGNVVPSRVADRLPVTTGYGTNWSYDIHKHDGGYVVTFQPRDVESRRTKGGHVGGYLSGTSISGTPKTYRTKKAAFEAIAAHARRGQYLLYKNGLVSCDGVVLRNPNGPRSKGGNPTRRRNTSAQARGLAKGQSLMAEAAQAYRNGEYDNMAEALHGVSMKRNGRRR